MIVKRSNILMKFSFIKHETFHAPQMNMEKTIVFVPITKSLFHLDISISYKCSVIIIRTRIRIIAITMWTSKILLILIQQLTCLTNMNNLLAGGKLQKDPHPTRLQNLYSKTFVQMINNSRGASLASSSCHLQHSVSSIMTTLLRPTLFSSKTRISIRYSNPQY